MAMIRLERLEVVAVTQRPGRYDLVVEREGRREKALAFAHLTPRPAKGQWVICNTTAMSLGLGTGGVHLVIAVEGWSGQIGEGGHAMKLRYSPLQVAVDSLEEDQESDPLRESLDGARVIVCPLHSLIAPAAVTIKALAPRANVAYVMTDQAALPLSFSDLVANLTDRRLLDRTVTTGQSFGGDVEAATVHSGLLAAKHDLGADVILVGMGPGNLGTGSRFGFAAISAVAELAAARALGGDVSLAARISLADKRERHQGVSHHTRTMIELDPSVTRLPLPECESSQRRSIEKSLSSLSHEAVWVDVERVKGMLEEHSDLMQTMGRGLQDDPMFFAGGAAAGIDSIR